MWGIVYAAETSIDACKGTGGFENLCKLGTGDIGKVVGTAVNFIFVIAALIALAYLIYGAIKWIISEGDKSNVETARNQIVAAIIGLVIIALSYLIINVIIGFFLPGKGLGNLQLPSL